MIDPDGPKDGVIDEELDKKLKEEFDTLHFLPKEPPKEVVDNIVSRVADSGITDPVEFQEKVQEGIKIARETRAAVDNVLTIKN